MAVLDPGGFGGAPGRVTRAWQFWILRLQSGSYQRTKDLLIGAETGISMGWVVFKDPSLSIPIAERIILHHSSARYYRVTCLINCIVKVHFQTARIVCCKFYSRRLQVQDPV